MTRGALGLALALALLGAGCAKVPVVAAPPPPPEPIARTDLYILLPGADGKVGKLTVTHQGQEKVLDTPHAAATIGKPGAFATGTTSEDETRQIFEAALQAQPPRPTSFMLHFLLDSDEFTPQSKVAVDDVLKDIARRPAPEVVVIGHTDTMGTDEYNDRLSQQRAERIRARLIELGVAQERIQTSGRGKREPLVPTGDQVAEPRNRRVEIVVR